MTELVTISTIECEKGFRIGLIGLNNGKALNALTLDMLSTIYDQLISWIDDPAIVSVVLHSDNEKAFCAGGDVKAMHGMASQSTGLEMMTHYFDIEYRCDYLIHTYPKPVIAWGHGIVMGGGMGLFMGASHRIVTPESLLAMPEVNIGLYPDVGATWFLNRLPLGIGLFLGLTGAAVNAADSLDIQFAHACFENSEKQCFLSQLSMLPWTGYNSDRAKVTELIAKYQEADLPPNQLMPFFAQIQAACSVDTLPECIANLNAIDGSSVWLDKARQSLHHGSAITAHLCFRQLHDYRSLNLLEAFQLEIGLSVQCGLQGDFREGVRARLIDKCGEPQWLYATVEDVPSSKIDALLTPPWSDNPLHNLKPSPGRYL